MALERGEVSASHPCHFILWDRRLGGPRAGLDAVEKRNSIEVRSLYPVFKPIFMQW
jgi:hypothetical protein